MIICLLAIFLTITTASADILVESDHPYANNFEYTWPPITESGATQIRLHLTKLDIDNHDELILLDKDGNKLVSYDEYWHGVYEEDMWTEWFSRDTLKVKLKTNGYGTAYGFQIDKLETRTNMAPSGALPESYHPYANNFEYTWPPITEPDATQIRLHFTKLDLDNHDELILLDKDGNELVSYDEYWHGVYEEDMWTEWFSRDTLKVKLKTNGYGTAYGFQIDKLETRTNMAPSGALPESYHPYANNFQYTWPPITEPGATQIRLYFIKLYLAEGDKLILLDKYDNIIAEYGGPFSAYHNDYIWTEWFSGDTIKIQLQTNAKETDYGFQIEKIETRGAIMPTEAPTSIQTSPTPTVNVPQIIGNILVEHDKLTLSTGASIDLKDGYELTAKEIDIVSQKVWLGLSRYGTEIDNKVLSVGSTYSYIKNIDDIEYLLVKTKVDAVFRGTNTNIVQLVSTYQYQEGAVAATTSAPTPARTPVITQSATQATIPATSTAQENTTSKTTLIFGGVFVLIVLVLMFVSKSNKKGQKAPRPKSTAPKSTPSPEPHAAQEAADREQKRMEMQRLAELRNNASSKLKRAKGMLNKAGQLGIDTSQIEDILNKAEQAFQKENYTHTIDYVKNYLALIDQAEKNKKQLEQMQKSASDQIKSAKFSIEKAERIGVTVQHARELNTKAQSAFDANGYNSAISYANKSRDASEQLIDKSKPSISIELPTKMEYKAWKHRDLIVANEGNAHAVGITITFLIALEVRDLKVIKRLDAGERKTINFNLKPTEKGEVPVDYSIEFKDLMDRVYKTEDTATIQISTGTETAWGSATSPIEKVKTDSNKLVVLRKDEFFNGFIRLKISVQNKMQLTATDVALDIEHDENVLRFDHHEPDTYAIKNGKIQLGNISSNNDRTITLYFEGLICSKGGEINCRIDYKDAYGKPDLVRMEPVKIPIVCPIFKTEQDINIGRLKELVASLPAQSSKEFLLPGGVSTNKALALCREVIQMHDVRHVRTFKTTDDRTYETWYYGKTKVEMIDLVIKASVSKETERIEIFVAAPDQKDIMGLLAELGRNISKRGESLGKLAPVFNVSIKDSQIIRSNLLGACDINGICDGNVVIEDSSVRRSSIANNANNVSIHIKDSNVERSTIGAGTKKCPDCGIEVEDEQKFCLECGAKL